MYFNGGDDSTEKIFSRFAFSIDTVRPKYLVALGFLSFYLFPFVPMLLKLELRSETVN